jgi:hypothetical protein
MKKTVSVKKNLQAKKVGVFNLTLGEPIVWLKPGDKLKCDTNDMQDYYLDRFGQVPYRKVFYNGQQGFIVTSALDEG